MHTHHTRRTHRPACIVRPRHTASAAAVLLLASSAGASPFEVRQLAVLGQQVPGMEPGVVWEYLAAPTIRDGQAWFRADYTGGGSTGFGVHTKDSLWFGAPGQLAPRARVGDTLTDTTVDPPVQTEVLGVQGYFPLGNGRAAFVSSVQSPSPQPRSNQALTISGPDGNEAIARVQSPAPGVGPDAVYNAFGHFAIRGSGDTLIYGAEYILPDRQRGHGLWHRRNGQTDILVHEGATLPGRPDLELTSMTAAPPIRLNNAGNLLFEGTLGTRDHASLIVGTRDDLAPVFEPGDAAPGLPSGTTFDTTRWSGDFSGEGNILARTTLEGPGIDPTNDQALWIGGRDQTRLIARAGDQVPGASPGTRWSDFTIHSQRMALADNEHAAFIATTIDDTSATTTGLWAGDADTLRNITNIGEQAPGMPAGVEFSSFQEVYTNSRGDIVFRAQLEGIGSSLWAMSDDGTLGLLAYAGQLIEVGPGDVREVSMVPGSGVESRTRLGENGELAYVVFFTGGGRGMFHTIVPAPGTLGLLALAGLAAVRRRRA